MGCSKKGVANVIEVEEWVVARSMLPTWPSETVKSVASTLVLFWGVHKNCDSLGINGCYDAESLES
jgi:hypothetical protein